MNQLWRNAIVIALGKEVASRLDHLLVIARVLCPFLVGQDQIDIPRFGDVIGVVFRAAISGWLAGQCLVADWAGVDFHRSVTLQKPPDEKVHPLGVD